MLQQYLKTAWLATKHVLKTQNAAQTTCATAFDMRCLHYSMWGSALHTIHAHLQHATSWCQSMLCWVHMCCSSAAQSLLVQCLPANCLSNGHSKSGRIMPDYKVMLDTSVIPGDALCCSTADTASTASAGVPATSRASTTNSTHVSQHMVPGAQTP